MPIKDSCSQPHRERYDMITHDTNQATLTATHRPDTPQIPLQCAIDDLAAVLVKVNQFGGIILSENDAPRYLIIDIEQNPPIEMTEDEKIMFIAKRILRKHKAAFEELAK